jgi:3-keto-5-aminohexanoate cleavage enzyme
VPDTPLVITAAITGSVTSSDQSPNLPLSAEEIVEAAVSSWRAGAAVIHVHARTEDGTPTQALERFALLKEGIEAAGCEAVLNFSTGSAGGRATLHERLEVLDLVPEMASLDAGSINFGDERVFENPYWWLREAAARMRAVGTIPELEVFDGGMIENGRRLIAEGLVAGPGVWQLCLGVRGGAPADLPTVAHLLQRLPEGAFWSMLGVGRHQLPVNLVSLAFGGHVRTGLEDNVLYHRGVPAASNAQLVERIVRLAGEAGRPVATPEQARELLRRASPGATR